MRIISTDDAAAWFCAHGVRITEAGLPDLREEADGGLDFSLPADAGKRTAMVKQQMATLMTASTLLVWLDDWSVWPSGQWHHLFERFRISYGSDASLIAKPAHLVARADAESAVSIAVYAVLMLWDCYVIADTG